MKRYKNYCICKKKGGVIYRDIDCFAIYFHNARKTILMDLDKFYIELNSTYRGRT